MKKVLPDKPISDLRPFEVQCSSTKCDEGFHYFTSLRKPKGGEGEVGDCRECGNEGVDWPIVYGRTDKKYTIESLNKELLRYVCWNNPLEPDVETFAKQRGKLGIMAEARVIIEKKIAKIPEIYFDNLCTPNKGKEIIHYAQHATATCCRKCLKRWYNIPDDQLLSQTDIEFCLELIEKFIDKRLPNLNTKPLSESVQVTK